MAISVWHVSDFIDIITDSISALDHSKIIKLCSHSFQCLCSEFLLIVVFLFHEKQQTPFTHPKLHQRITVLLSNLKFLLLVDTVLKMKNQILNSSEAFAYSNLVQKKKKYYLVIRHEKNTSETVFQK